MSVSLPNQELFDLIFSPKGLLSCYLKDFEERPEQREMAEQIAKVYENDGIALIEAGTGTGKSLAYLIPAVIWALKHKEKTVISTHTISLQEQLVKKDIPFLLKVLDVDIKVSLIKGMNNYLCLRKWDEIEKQETKEFEALEGWVEKTKVGSLSEITFPLSPGIWEKVNAEADLCNHTHCPHYKQCFFFKERRQAADAQLLVVNHHLLLSHLVARGQKGFEEQKSAIPPHQRIIIDEAHHLEEIAISSLSHRIDFLSLSRLLHKLFSETHPTSSRLSLLRRTLNMHSFSPLEEGFSSLVQKLDIELPARKRDLFSLMESAFQKLENFCRSFFSNQEEQRWRLKPEIFKGASWKEEVEKVFLSLVAQMNSYAQTLYALEKTLEEIKNPTLQEKLATHCLEIHAIAKRLEEKAEALLLFFSEKEEELRVRWVEKNASSIALVDAHLDVSSYLREHLFNRLSTVALCSATLATNRNFQFVRQRLGIESEKQETRIAEKIYHSPFDYQKRTLLLVPTDLPLPSAPEFEESAAAFIYKALCMSRGNAFVLFTSYSMLKECYEQVSKLIADEPFSLLKQGDASRQTLIERFKNEEGSVLFGTDSFWEGVDVAGEALRCVILVKLPFKAPSDPLVEAQTEALQRQGKDPFSDYAVPHAAVKFKQGFGRLMRKKNDRGCIICLDKRLVTKSYGKIFLNSLPPARTHFETSAQVLQEMKTFYNRT